MCSKIKNDNDNDYFLKSNCTFNLIICLKYWGCTTVNLDINKGETMGHFFDKNPQIHVVLVQKFSWYLKKKRLDNFFLYNFQTHLDVCFSVQIKSLKQTKNQRRPVYKFSITYQGNANLTFSLLDLTKYCRWTERYQIS